MSHLMLYLSSPRSAPGQYQEDRSYGILQNVWSHLVLLDFACLVNDLFVGIDLSLLLL